MINLNLKWGFIFIVLFIVPLISFCQSDRTRYFPRKTEVVREIPNREDVWVFILAGQSNMAGRALVEPQDTIPSERILTINSKGQLILAKEPLHFQEPGGQGLDCGLSFGKAMIENIPPKTKILLLPVAIGGSSIRQWLGDSLFRKVKLLSNFREKAEFGKKQGVIKGILWHQGENDANPSGIPQYGKNLALLFTEFRSIAGNPTLPILIGELSSFPKAYENHMKINQIIKEYSSTDQYTAVIPTSDFSHKGDNIHFDSKSERTMGQRYAAAFLEKFK
jgi:hypothetical protein